MAKFKAKLGEAEFELEGDEKWVDDTLQKWGQFLGALMQAAGAVEALKATEAATK